MDLSINPVVVVLGRAKISQEDLSEDQLCDILESVMWEIKVGLKYLDDYKPLGNLLNGMLSFGYGEFATPKNAMPDFNNTDYNARTKFLVLSIVEEQKSDPKSCERKFGVLLLVDERHLAILKIVCFRQENHFVVCKSSFVADCTNKGMFNPSSNEIKALIRQKIIYVSSIVDKLFLCFNSTIEKREEYLRSMRLIRNALQCIHGRFS